MPKGSRSAKAEQIHVVRRWTSSPCIYGWDSRERKDNPDFHPPIGLTNKGTFVDDRLEPLAPKDVPAYILTEAKKANLSIVWQPPRQQTGTLRDAMRQSGVEDQTGLDLNAR
jgi:hypothetical protein